MFTRLLGWFREQKAWKADHIQSWKGLTELDSNGISRFQTLALGAFDSSTIQIQFERMGQTEAYFHATIPGTDLEVYVFSDGAQVLNDAKFLLRAEEWDYRTPDELFNDLLLTVSAAVNAT